METGTAPGSGAPGATGVATAPAGAGTAPGRLAAGNARESPAPALAGGAMAGSVGDEGMAAPGIQPDARLDAYAREA